ncbi:hypothetical protein CPB83DRAFT_864507 [Crepidotus variabilis]|uniref:Uncharacterized protein n=1 Tax=Crepidotus variabilis TaxID=179855 RepID=A0A9P6JJ07_9AGAR|nr:hypothetical protein CPB83DRAFT_864507 [Crepidotus variabilis]
MANKALVTKNDLGTHLLDLLSVGGPINEMIQADTLLQSLRRLLPKQRNIEDNTRIFFETTFSTFRLHFHPPPSKDESISLFRRWPSCSQLDLDFFEALIRMNPKVPGCAVSRVHGERTSQLEEKVRYGKEGCILGRCDRKVQTSLLRVGFWRFQTTGGWDFMGLPCS